MSEKGKRQAPAAEKIIHKPLENVIHDSMMPYAEYVILERALPRVEDGLKPVQRRILYTMMELALWPDKPHRKSARIVGDCLGKYHPHGDTSVYDAMVRMAQDFNMSVPLIDGHGNFGSIDGDAAAAMRYTEARLTPAAMELLRDIEKDTVHFSLNFDDTLKEPDMLPGRFPNLIVNGASGIAVGLATNIPPHNMAEAIDGVIEFIKNPNITLEELMEIIKGPDFPTGGFCSGGEELIKAYQTGRGKLLVRARTSIERDKNGKSRIVITELPYQVNKAALLERILKLTEEKKGILTAITDIRDESDRTGMRAVIEIKKDQDPEKVLKYLFKYSDLQVTFGVNIVAIADGKPQQMGLVDICRYYVNYQKRVVTLRTQYDLEDAQQREHILQGLMIAVDNIDRVIKIIRSSKNTQEAKSQLMQTFDLTGVQAQAILDMRLKRLTALEMETLKTEYQNVVKLIAELESILSSERKLKSVVIKELSDIKKKYPSKRRTVIVEQFENIDVTELEPPASSEPCDIICTAKGLIKRISTKNSAKSQDSELCETLFGTKCMTCDKLCLFTDKGNAFFISATDIPECKIKDRGTNIAGLLSGLERNERVIAMLNIQDSSPDVLFFTRKGGIKRTQGSEYLAKRSKIQACGLKQGDAVFDVQFCDDEKAVTIISCSGNLIRFNCNTVPAQGRTASGVKAVALDNNDEIIFAGILEDKDELVLFSERGYAKRMPASEFEIQNRGGKGQKCIAFAKDGSNGQELAAAFAAKLTDGFEIIQKSGARTRLNASEIPAQTKQGKGAPVVMALFDDVVTEAIKLF